MHFLLLKKTYISTSIIITSTINILIAASTRSTYLTCTSSTSSSSSKKSNTSSSIKTNNSTSSISSTNSINNTYSIIIFICIIITGISLFCSICTTSINIIFIIGITIFIFILLSKKLEYKFFAYKNIT